jgi:hypothetical protein
MTAALTSWRDGPAKQAIVDFVESAIRDGPRFVPAAERIAAFDNDRTLWVEQPMPPRFDFVLRKWMAEVEADLSLAGQQPYKAIIENDWAFFEGVATQGSPQSLRRCSRRSPAHGLIRPISWAGRS